MTAVSTRIGRRSASRQAGLTYFFVLLTVAVMGVWLAAVGTLWSAAAQRDKEQALLDVGHAYREAIRTYYERTPGALERYPETLDQLLLDRRYLGVRRHLRKLYLDPITGGEWAIVPAPDGGVMGVRSTSELQPIKQSGFSQINSSFAEAHRYSDWRFVYVPPAAPSAQEGE